MAAAHRDRRRQMRLLLYGLVALSPHLTLVFVAVGSSVVPATTGDQGERAMPQPHHHLRRRHHRWRAAVESQNLTAAAGGGSGGLDNLWTNFAPERDA